MHRECRECEGTGRVKSFLFFRKKCLWCNGKGYIKNSDDIVTRPPDMDMVVANTIWDGNGSK